ncbi:MAG TPA: RluA family pseudouridine synthase [Marinagarivorans sp.]
MRIFTYTPPAGLPPVIYQDDDYLAINKPSGLLSNPGRAENTYDCALTRLQTAFGEIHLVHRLDCDTSGVMVFAKHKKAEGALKKQLQEREIEKTYHALVWGVPKLAKGVIQFPLGPNPDDRPLQKIEPKGKAATTRYHLLEANTDSDTALLELKPETGRTHQLRVHLEGIGHPILGDTFYGHAQAQAMQSRLCLHAKTLQFSHPFSGQPVVIDTAVPFNLASVATDIS